MVFDFFPVRRMELELGSGGLGKLGMEIIKSAVYRRWTFL